MLVTVVPKTTLDGGPDDAEMVPAGVQERCHRETSKDGVSNDKIKGRD